MSQICQFEEKRISTMQINGDYRFWGEYWNKINEYLLFDIESVKGEW